MATDWRCGLLGDVVELKRGYDLPEQARQRGSIPIVSSSGPSGTHAESKVQGPGVVTGRYGTIGKVFFVEEPFWPLNTTLYVRDFKGNDPRFISYFLRTIDFWAYSDKAAVPGVNRNHLHEAHVVWPDVDTQRQIAAILGALDDKIELNRRMNETLEDMARALFRSWLVDFERTNGAMPAGWSIGTLASVCTAAGGEVQTGPFGSQLHASDYIAEGVPVVMPTNIRDRRVVPDGIVRISPADAERLARHRLFLGDLVYSRRGDVEKHAIVGREEEGWLCGTGCLRVRPSRVGQLGMSSHYLSLWLDQPEQRAWISARAIGATMPNLNTKILGEVPVLLPDSGTLAAFDEFMEPLDARIRALRAETTTLSELRDLLLPKLLSGELRIRDAERVLEAAAS